MGSTPRGSEDPRRLVANWTSIPSDLPSPARALLIQVNGANNDGGTTCKFITVGVWCNGNTTDFDSVVPGSSPGMPAKFCLCSLMVKTRAYTSPKHRPDKPACAGSSPARGTIYGL